MPGEELLRFRPNRHTGQLTPYDPNKEYRENKEKRNADILGRVTAVDG